MKALTSCESYSQYLISFRTQLFSRSVFWIRRGLKRPVSRAARAQAFGDWFAASYLCRTASLVAELVENVGFDKAVQMIFQAKLPMEVCLRVVLHPSIPINCKQVCASCAFEARILQGAFIYWRTQSCPAHSFRRTKPRRFIASFGNTGSTCT